MKTKMMQFLSVCAITVVAGLTNAIILPRAQATQDRCESTIVKIKDNPISQINGRKFASSQYRIYLTCPGSIKEAVQLSSVSANGSVTGLGNIKNVGSCPISIAAINSERQLLKPNIRIYPGKSRKQWTPPSGATAIIASCFSDCHNEAVLEYTLTTYAQTDSQTIARKILK